MIFESEQSRNNSVSIRRNTDHPSQMVFYAVLRASISACSQKHFRQSWWFCKRESISRCQQFITRWPQIRQYSHLLHESLTLLGVATSTVLFTQWCQVGWAHSQPIKWNYIGGQYANFKRISLGHENNASTATTNVIFLVVSGNSKKTKSDHREKAMRYSCNPLLMNGRGLPRRSLVLFINNEHFFLF